MISMYYYVVENSINSLGLTAAPKEARGRAACNWSRSVRVSSLLALVSKSNMQQLFCSPTDQAQLPVRPCWTGSLATRRTARAPTTAVLCPWSGTTAIPDRDRVSPTHTQDCCLTKRQRSFKFKSYIFPQ